MSLLLQYLIKLSISLGVVWLFYQLALRRLTFYNSNRWYLLFFTVLSFCIPFINFSFINNDNTAQIGFVQFIPSVHQYTVALENATDCPIPIWSTQYDKWDWTVFSLMAGAAVFFFRFMIRCFSFLRIRNRAELISDDGIKIYQVEESIIPFSFGNSVFINCNQHSAEELVEIVRHEFVHVRQKHTLDIIWAELLCILNWYNPFAWLLKKSIRQNLEFIADNNVIENGMNKKHYQYLLLKVIGNNQYSIATQFNFSSLKKRIAMMNKTKSAKRQVARFLFLVPVLAIILVSFRKSFSDPTGTPTGTPEPAFTDTVPEVKTPNSKGYIINIKDKSGECEVVIKDKSDKEVKRLLLTEWNEKEDYYENLYGEIPPPPPASPALPAAEQWIKSANPDVKSVSVHNYKASVTLRNGKKEEYDLSITEQKKTFESKYGKLPEPPIPPLPVKAGQAAALPLAPAPTAQPGDPVLPPAPPTPPAPATPPSKVIGVKPKETVKADFDLKDNVITVTPLSGPKEVYDLNKDAEKKQFSEKYGEPVLAKDISTAVNNTDADAVLTTTIKSNIVNNSNRNAVTNTPTGAKIASDNVVNAKLSTAVSSPVNGNIINAVVTTTHPAIVTYNEVDILVTILKTTTEEDLNKLISAMKEKGYELKFTDKNYADGILTGISGTIKHKGNSSTFSATDFTKLIIASYTDGDKTRFRINIQTKNTKEVI